jgi:tetratricopeptide (TPR) repeat protein
MSGSYKEDSDFQAANEAFEKGRFTEAMEHMTKVAERHPDEPEVQQRFGLCAFERAMQRLETDTSTPADWRSVIDTLEAVAASGDTKQIASSLAVAHHNLGVCLNQQGSYEEAGEQFRRALVFNPDMTDASISLAINQADLGDRETAEQLLREVIERSPGELQARQVLGLILSAQGKDSEAVEQFKRAQPPERDNAAVHYSRGVSHLNLGELKEAEAAFRQTLELNPEFVPAHYNLGLVLRERGDPSGAERCFEEVTRLEPDSPGGYFCLASLYEKRDPALAIPTWEKYLEVAAKLPSEAEIVDKVAAHVAALKKIAEEPQEGT